jgi:hypothetical protein
MTLPPQIVKMTFHLEVFINETDKFVTDFLNEIFH